MDDGATLKPGYKSTEFVLTLLANVFGAVAASGELIKGSSIARIVGLASIVLSTMLYTWQRSQVKIAHITGGDAAPAQPPAPGAQQ